jgi:CRISPR-associated endonuclease/helicase Cas3
MQAIAHGPDHSLAEHLRAVADVAARYAPAASAHWAHQAGLWHDLGKFRPGFQTYVRLDENAHIENRGVGQRDKSHSAAGALHAMQSLETRFAAHGRRAGWVLAQLIAAHHAGLYDAQDLRERLQGRDASESRREYEEASRSCRQHEPALLSSHEGLDAAGLLASVPGLHDAEPLAQSLWLRMLFSALVDADFLDTEAYFQRDRGPARAGFLPLADCLARLEAHLDSLAQSVRAQGRNVNATIRDRYYGAASSTPGAVFPTLMRLKNAHLKKLAAGQEAHYERLVGSICGSVEQPALTDFPRQLDLHAQGLFALGYYHQRQSLFTPKAGRPDTDNPTAEED